MWRLCIIAALAATLVGAQAQAAEITGQYVEVRNCDVWTGPCFANAEGNLVGKNAALVWHVDAGTFNGAKLDNLTVVAVIQATDTLGARQSGPTQAVILVDNRATQAQRDALVKLAQLQGGELLANILSVQPVTISANCCSCDGHACADINAGEVTIKTRCLDDSRDHVCGNETAYYPPLSTGVQCVPAVAEHGYRGTNLGTTWREVERRGAYVGTFTMVR